MKITRTEFEEMTLEEIIEKYYYEHDSFTTYESLKDFAKEQIENDNLGFAIHILNGLDNRCTDYYLYDYGMGTLETLTAIEDKEDIEHLFDIEEDGYFEE